MPKYTAVSMSPTTREGEKGAFAKRKTTVIKMIKFIYGNTTDATQTVMEMLRSDAQSSVRSFLIVPEQYTVESERRILNTLPARAQLITEVLNFSRLYNRVCREYGGLEYNYITKPLKYLLMWRNLRELSPLLEVYGEYTDNDASLCEMMISTIGEFKASCVTPAALERAADSMPAQSTSAKKLRDLSLIYVAYENLVSQSFSDSADDISKLSDILGEHRFFEGCSVYVDGFTSFTAAEHKVIDRIFSDAQNVTVTIPLPAPRANSVFSLSISESEHRLIKNAEKHGGAEFMTAPECGESTDPCIKYLADNIWSASPESAPDGLVPPVSLTVCQSPYSEAEAAAQTVLSLMREGYRCRDIVVVARDAEQYRGIIEPAFERCGVPLYFSEKTSLISTPLVKLILSALRMKMYNLRTSDIISNLKTELYGFGRRDCDLFEQYITTWQICGGSFTKSDFTMNPDGFTDVMSTRGEEILNAANRIRSGICSLIVPLFERLDTEASVLGKCRAVYDYIVAAGTENRLAELAQARANAGNVREAEEYSRCFATVCDCLADIASALPQEDTEMTVSEFYELLSLCFSRTDMGTIPTAADQAVFGSASMLRAGAPKCALILGLCEGVFPAAVTDSGLLNFADRSALLDAGIELPSRSETMSSDELMYVYRAFSMPTQRLCLFTYSAGTDTRARTPSLPFIRVQKLFEQLKPVRYDSRDILSFTGSVKSTLPYLDSIRDPLAKAAFEEYLSEHDGATRPAAKIPISDTECELSEETVDAVFGKSIRLTASRMEKYIKCHFGFYCTYVLKLREEKQSRFRADNIGNFIHFVLENLLRALADDGGLKSGLPREELEELTRRTVKEYIERISPPDMPPSGRLTHLCRRLYDLCLLLLSNILDEFAQSSFSPEFFELNINGAGDNPSPLKLTLADSTEISFTGIVDRVDVLRRDGKVYLRVVDYKSGTKTFSLEDIKYGMNIQMLLYLFTLTKNHSRKFLDRLQSDEPVPSGVMYLSSNIGPVELEDYTDGDEVLRLARKKLNRAGLLCDDEEILKCMNESLSPDFLAGIKQKSDGALYGKALASAEMFEKIQSEIEDTVRRIAEQIRSGDADAEPFVYKKNDPCTYCPMKPVCRRELG